MARARRYEGNGKLNVKKLIAVIVLLLVIIMFIIGIKSMLTSHSENISGRVEALTYYTIYDNGKWGVINSNGDTVVKPTYDEMIVIPDNTKAVFICTYDVNYQDGTYKAKAIDNQNKEIIKGYDKVEAIANYDKNIWYELGVLKVQKEGKYGLVDFYGKELLACEYDNIDTLKGVENSLIISKDGKYGVSDKSGNIIVKPEYKKIEKIENNYKNGYIVVNSEDKYGIIGFDKTVVLECKYDEVKGIYSNNLFVIKKDGKYQIINKEEETVLKDKFDDIVAINGENIVAKKGDKLGLLDIKGETKIKFEYEELKSAGTENYIGKKNGKYGAIDVKETEKLAFNYSNIRYVASGDFFVVDIYEEGKILTKVLDSNFEEKIAGEILEINEPKGYIKISKDDNYKYYNFKFEEKTASNFLTANTIFLSKKDGKYGYVDKEGNVVVDYIYDDGTEQNAAGYAAVRKNGVWGSIDSKGKVVINPEYNLDNNPIIDFVGAWHLCEDKNANYYLDV